MSLLHALQYTIVGRTLSVHTSASSASLRTASRASLAPSLLHVVSSARPRSWRGSDRDEVDDGCVESAVPAGAGSHTAALLCGSERRCWWGWWRASSCS